MAARNRRDTTVAAPGPLHDRWAGRLTAAIWVGTMTMAFTAAKAGETVEKLNPVVEIDEDVYRYQPANNGAGPLWCYGSTCITRVGDDVLVSGLETLPDMKPLNNVRWTLFRRRADGWQLAQRDQKGRTREPCPIGSLPDGRVFLSVNPTLTDVDVYNGPSLPQVLELSASRPGAPFKTESPGWTGEPAFTEHSYRGFAADGPGGELLLMNILGHEAQYVSFRDKAGQWHGRGKLIFPMGHGYEKPEPIRLCYPVIALRRRAVHVLAISDIVEPVKTWREFKRQLTGKSWDYDFRRLYYTYTPDIMNEPFVDWVEVASREKTAGHIRNCDTWVDGDGKAHLLWQERSLDERLREKFFPDEALTYTLKHAVVRDGKVASVQDLATGGEGASPEVPGLGRLHATPDGRLFAVYYCGGRDLDGAGVSENRIVEILPDGKHGEPVRIALARPFTSFMTATERGGSPPSTTLELLGTCAGAGNAIRYARLRLW